MSNVHAGFTRRATIVTPDISEMVINGAVRLAAETLAHDRAFFRECQEFALADKADAALQQVESSRRRVEQAVRRTNPGASEAQIQALTRSL